MASIPKHRFHFHRFSERLGTGHSVESVFRPRRRPLEPDLLVTDESIRVNERFIWFGGAMFFAMCGMVPVVARLLPTFPGFHTPPEVVGTLYLSLAGVAFALAALWVVLGVRNVPTLPWLHPAIGSGTLLIAIATVSRPHYAPDFMNMFLVPAIAAAFYLPRRDAIPHISAIVGVLIYIAAAGNGLPHTGTIVAFTIVFIVGASAIMSIVHERIQHGISLSVDIAGKDPLTGVANLRQLRQRLARELKSAERRDVPVTLVIVNTDNLDEVNRGFSYTLGDAVLVACARAMQRVIRRGELLARRGGDEFAVVAIGETSDELATLIERLRAAVRKERLRLCPDVSPEISVGHATWRSGEGSEALIRRADRSLHVAKSLGPNQL